MKILKSAVIPLLFFGVACGSPKDARSIEQSNQSVGKTSSESLAGMISASCAVNSLNDKSLISEQASFQVTGDTFKLEYGFTVETDGLKKQGKQQITGIIDQEFNSVFKPKTLYFLLTKGELKSSFEGKLTHRQLSKTEVLLKNDRLIIEEQDIVLDLRGCQVKALK
jgi:hypothetical protein